MFSITSDVKVECWVNPIIRATACQCQPCVPLALGIRSPYHSLALKSQKRHNIRWPLRVGLDGAEPRQSYARDSKNN